MPLVCPWRQGTTDRDATTRLKFSQPERIHLVLRLIASFVLFYTSRVICKGRLTMEEIIFSLKHYWRFVDMEALELQALS